MLSKEFIKSMKAKLEEEKIQVEAKIKKYSAREKPMDNPDLDDLGQDASQDILEESLVDVHEGILAKINKALGKIQQGIYGTCEKCGVAILEDDLKKLPWAEHCRQCRGEN